MEKEKVDASFQPPTVTHTTAGDQVEDGDTKEQQDLGSREAQSGHLSAVVVSSFWPGWATETLCAYSREVR